MSIQDFNNQIEGALEKAKNFLLSKYQLNSYDLEDVLQEASLKAIKNLSSFKEKCSFETWFISICKSEANSIFRKNKKSEQLFSKDASEKEKDFQWEESPVTRNGELEEYSLLIGDALSKLSDNHRQIIEFAMKNTNSSKEIAELLAIPLNSARTRLFYAKKKMKSLIQSHAHKSNIQLLNN
jgi:RNA polymerase sigma-70 factor, ECF subfamily